MDIEITKNEGGEDPSAKESSGWAALELRALAGNFLSRKLKGVSDVNTDIVITFSGHDKEVSIVDLMVEFHKEMIQQNESINSDDVISAVSRFDQRVDTRDNPGWK